MSAWGTSFGQSFGNSFGTLNSLDDSRHLYGPLLRRKEIEQEDEEVIAMIMAWLPMINRRAAGSERAPSPRFAKAGSPTVH